MTQTASGLHWLDEAQNSFEAVDRGLCSFYPEQEVDAPSLDGADGLASSLRAIRNPTRRLDKIDLSRGRALNFAFEFARALLVRIIPLSVTLVDHVK